ncbi:MAG: hypothetical protein IBJ18_02170 [Phycisphaerales bacterium]|nr:hypothetical protein [Phycisphaerales bacterium]
MTTVNTPGMSIALQNDQPCIKCSYNLRGLPIAGTCPECGSLVSDSLRGFNLRFAAPEYLAKVNRGLSFVLNSILAIVIITVLTIAVTIATAGRQSELVLLLQFAQILTTATGLAGYWWYTEPDPGYTGIEKPNSARQIVRIAVCIQAVALLMSTAVVIIGFTGSGGGGGGSAASPGGAAMAVVGLFTIAFLVLNLVAYIAQFVGTMRYTAWMFSRVPDADLAKKAKMYVWLLPLIYVVGMIALGLGPLIALVMYWNLLDKLRKHVKTVAAA